MMIIMFIQTIMILIKLKTGLLPTAREIHNNKSKGKRERDQKKRKEKRKRKKKKRRKKHHVNSFTP